MEIYFMKALGLEDYYTNKAIISRNILFIGKIVYFS